ncbi:MAG: isoprenyl transferase [Alphaproteobacteria bacterium]|nr:MAG: isoprenyl transferase [Alphaproteobacteria bacterium]
MLASGQGEQTARAGGANGIVPRHVAIIMDGNGRWAAARGLPRALGHRQGAEAVRGAVRTARSLGIEVLTLYAFSSENWKRPADEVRDLMALLRLYLRREIAELDRNDVRMRFIGDRTALSSDLQELIAHAERKTAENRGLQLVLAVNYGGRNEIVCAARRLAEEVAAGRLAPAEIDEDAFARHLELADLPDPDLVIRTSGEQRLSNFLLWQSAYSELLFLDCLWPDFDEATFRQAVADYTARERRFGGR